MNHNLRAFARGATILSATLSVAALTAPAFAAPMASPTEQQININAARDGTLTETRIVHTRDLDLASLRGREVLDRRLRIAANGVCHVFHVSADRHLTEYRACYGSALTSARAQAQQRAALNDAGTIAVSAG